MTIQLEVCIDNLESLHLAISGGATRIELCSSLALGGLTPSYGFMKKSAELSSVPVYAMIRPRQGDFLYSTEDIESMIEDIHMAKQAGLQGVVFGTLNPQGNIDMQAAQSLMKAAGELGVTFHRAIDQCSDYAQAIEDIAALGCERILTSGLASTAEQGTDVIADMVKLAKGRFSIMAGAGVNIDNAANIIKHTGVNEVHLSGKTTRPSHMQVLADSAKMGSDSVDDFAIPVTNPKIIQAVKHAITTC
ncbi:copper homeostasis protein CutC [Vibrio rumoiensis]|uniref:PF03932 family protein CutC n=1 Tax=Vibrio rumoiensis 1S-45 TaxID=1188252 RepID=A0A1E5E5D7_9VIBR|nr:copper homeostasis protein CutC [Vibrio rumoiensis]OEF28634.1 copper homeostasis protein CutC [Vibrio rumoiensis 1S-45]